MNVEHLRKLLYGKKYIVGVDIGNDGSIFKNVTDSVSLQMMPESWDRRSAAITRIHQSFDADVVYAEDVHTMPGQGVVSSGVLMEQKGFIRGTCAGQGIRLEFMRPIQWQECFTMKRTKHFASETLWKKHLAEIAREHVEGPLVNEITHKNADSVLIWIWAAHKELGQPMIRLNSQLSFL